MTTNESVKLHMSFIKQKHKELIALIERFIDILVGDDLNQKRNYASSILNKKNELIAVLPNENQPQWLIGLNHPLTVFSQGSTTPPEIIKYLFKSLGEIKAHHWVFDNPDETAFDFDSIFEHYKKESRLPKLFDSIIKILEDIKDSGEVDSSAMLKALSKVIATLKQNKNGSYLSLSSSWDFFIAFLNNYMWAELSKIPFLGTALEALKKTFDETNEEMAKLHTNIQDDMAKKVQEEVKGLRGKNKTPFPSLGYDKSSGVIIDGKSRIEPNETA